MLVHARNGNVRWQRCGETVLGEKRTVIMLDCRAFSCQKHILKTELNYQDFFRESK